MRIPAADVPRPEAVRGRAFGDVKVQRGASDTVVSFRLQPGATARVEQRGNKLDVVFTMPGSRSGSTTSTGRDVSRNDAGPAPPSADSQRRGNTNSNDSVPGGSFQQSKLERSIFCCLRPTDANSARRLRRPNLHRRLRRNLAEPCAVRDSQNLACRSEKFAVSRCHGFFTSSPRRKARPGANLSSTLDTGFCWRN